jgi:hypothetical protein
MLGVVGNARDPISGLSRIVGHGEDDDNAAFESIYD